MNAILTNVPRLDSSGGGHAGLIDVRQFGTPYGCGPGGQLTAFPKLGAEITARQDATIAKVAEFYRDRWRSEPGFEDRYVQDAATDFVTSGLKRLLGPGEDVRRDEYDWLFVARNGRTPVIPSRQTLPPGYRTSAYHVRAHTGQAQFVDPNDVASLQRAGYNVEEKEYGASYYGIAWAEAVPESWEADILGEDLRAEREFGATLALDLFQESVSSFGNAAREIPGAFTQGDALVVGGGVDFATTTVSAEDMLRRMAYWDQLYKRANKVRASGVVMPEASRIEMQNTFFGTGGEGPSVWERAMDQLPWLANATYTERLNLANADGTAARWMLYSSNDRDFFIEHTPTMIFGPFPNRMEMEWVALRRIGGIVSKKPERSMYIDFEPAP